MKRIVRDVQLNPNSMPLAFPTSPTVTKSPPPPRRLSAFLNIAPPFRIDPTTEFSGDPLDGIGPVYITRTPPAKTHSLLSFLPFTFCISLAFGFYFLAQALSGLPASCFAFGPPRAIEP